MKLISSSQVAHHHLDAREFTYGRLCASIVYLLLGKSDICRSFNLPKHVVVISNIYNVSFSGKNKKDKMQFIHHTGYSGGLKSFSMQYYMKRGLMDHCVRRTVYGMLSKTSYFKKIVKTNIIFK